MKKTWVVLLVLVCLFQVPILPGESPGAGSSPCSNSLSPPFIAQGAKPNILIILDNSNSMDEDFYGNAVGSYDPTSKSAYAKQALQNLVTQLKDKANVGLMTYNLPSNIEKAYLYNDYYFASYNPTKSYCENPNPPESCQTWCVTGSTSARDDCRAACQNPYLDITDSIITDHSANSSYRQTYCPLVFPKTQMALNTKDTTGTNYIYYKGAYPMYTSDSYGDAIFAYSSDYSSANNAPNSYDMYQSKTGTSDGNNGYPTRFDSWTFTPTDSDIALGFSNFGQRMAMTYVGRTWFSNSAAASGYLKVPLADLSNTTQFNAVNNMLNPYANDSTGYMSCTARDLDTCSYVVNAGLTPTAGALKAALNYFNGSYSGQSSPISSVCQKNYIIYVTDGLPDTNLAGSTRDTLTNVMNEVKTQLSNLQTQVKKTFSKTSYTFPVKTFVLGMGLSPQAKANLDQMAVAGGTATQAGHAYYADNKDELTSAFENIVTNLLGRVASGSSISILSEGQTQMGANMLQGVFYPSKYFGSSILNWPGYLYDYWFYNSKTLNNIREDSVHDYLLELDQDNGLVFSFNNQTGLSVNRYSDPTGSGDPSQFVDNVDLDSLAPIWEAGRTLFGTTASSRQIYTVGSSGGLVSFDTTNTALTTPGSSLLGSSFDACLRGANDTATLQNLINYVRGTDIPNCRSRTVGLCSNGTSFNNTPCDTDSDCSAPYSSCKKNVWKLGDVVYSSPQVQIDYKYCSDGSSSFNGQFCQVDSDCTSPTFNSCKKKESVVYVGANDGMLHAFKTGIMTNQGVDASKHQVEKLIGIPTSDMGKELWAFIPKNSLPYLRCLAIPPPNSCHLYYNDLSPYIIRMVSGGVTKTVLIGGMRLGGGALDATAQYCFNSSGISNGNTCSGTSNCSAPYNASCSTAYHSTAPSDTCSPVICSNSSTCYNPSSCTGLSSYYALDITDAENPKLLWEFSHPLLGYSYSGPAVIHKWSDPAHLTGDQYFVMFASGPTVASTGSSIQNAQLFVLSLDSNLAISSVYAKDLGNAAKNGFGGRLFTTGLDVNADGYTDFVFFGYGYSASGNTGDWKGGIAKINTNNTDPSLALSPANWTYDVATYSNIAQLPITAKVQAMNCFDHWYLYSGTGRYFFPMDDYGPSGQSGKNYLMGVPFTCDQYNNNCMPNINSLNDNKNACSNLHKGPSFLDQAGWLYTLNDAETAPDGSSYLRERMTTDPSISAGNKIFFTTEEPSGDACGYGGRTRVWGLNCATGAALSDQSCAGYTIDDKDLAGTIYLQTSTGAINKLDPASSFTDPSTGNRTSPWTAGIPPENAPPVVPPSTPSSKSGQLIYWIER